MFKRYFLVILYSLIFTQTYLIITGMKINFVSIFDPQKQHKTIEKDGDIIDFTCLYRAYVYAECHLNIIYNQENQITNDYDKESIQNAMPQNIKNTNFLGLPFANYQTAKIFQHLCKNAFETGCHVKFLTDPNKNYHIYNKIHFLSLLPLNGPVVGFGASPDRKDRAFNIRHLKTCHNNESINYFDNVYKKMKHKYNDEKEYFNKERFKKICKSLDNSPCLQNIINIIVNDTIDNILDEIAQLHKNNTHACSIVLSSDISGESATLHAITFTIYKNQDGITVFVSEGANIKQDLLIKEKNTIKFLINNYEKIKEIRTDYKNFKDSPSSRSLIYPIAIGTSIALFIIFFEKNYSRIKTQFKKQLTLQKI